MHRKEKKNIEATLFSKLIAGLSLGSSLVLTSSCSHFANYTMNQEQETTGKEQGTVSEVASFESGDIEDLVMENDVRLLKQWIENKNFNINSKDELGDTLSNVILGYAVYYGSVKVFQYIFEHLLEQPNIKAHLGSKDRTSLLCFTITMALNTENLDVVNMVKRLLPLCDNEDINVKNSKNDNLLNLLFEYKRCRIEGSKQNIRLKLLDLLLKETEIDVENIGENGRSILSIAARNNDTKSIDIIFKNRPNVNVNQKNRDGRTPISLAIEQDSKDAFNLLINNKNIDVNSEIRLSSELNSYDEAWINEAKYLRMHTPFAIAIKFCLAPTTERGLEIVQALHDRIDTNVNKRFSCFTKHYIRVSSALECLISPDGSIPERSISNSPNSKPLLKFFLEEGKVEFNEAQKKAAMQLINQK